MSESQRTTELVAATTPLPDVAQRARHHSARRLLPYLLVLYVIAFLDRMNIGAAALQMPHDLGFSPVVIGFGAGVFFCGYFILGFPGALIAERWSARKLMGYIMIGWGIVTVFMAFIHTATQFYTVRFLLGATESGFFPGRDCLHEPLVSVRGSSEGSRSVLCRESTFLRDWITIGGCVTWA